MVGLLPRLLSKPCPEAYPLSLRILLLPIRPTAVLDSIGLNAGAFLINDFTTNGHAIRESTMRAQELKPNLPDGSQDF